MKALKTVAAAVVGCALIVAAFSSFGGNDILMYLTCFVWVLVSPKIVEIIDG
jgi:hypothetical protein